MLLRQLSIFINDNQIRMLSVQSGPANGAAVSRTAGLHGGQPRSNDHHILDRCLRSAPVGYEWHDNIGC
jgi:hypothetical protein